MGTSKGEPTPQVRTNKARILIQVQSKYNYAGSQYRVTKAKFAGSRKLGPIAYCRHSDMPVITRLAATNYLEGRRKKMCFRSRKKGDVKILRR